MGGPRGLVDEPATDGTGVPDETAPAHTGAVGGGREMLPAACDVVACGADGGSRAGRQAEACVAELAGMRRGLRWGEWQPYGEQECAPIGVPQPEDGVDQDPQRRGAQPRFGTHRPALEGQAGRPVTGKDRASPERFRQAVGVEGMGRTGFG